MLWVKPKLLLHKRILSLASSISIEEAKDRILLGKRSLGLTQSKKSIEKTAYHEAGHALTSILQENYPYSFYKVTILPRGSALGVSFSLPKDDEVGFSKEQLEACIIVSMAGRAAEVVKFGHIHTGAVSDFMNATEIAKKMVLAYGMGKLTGEISFINPKKISNEHPWVSNETAKNIDFDIKEILNNCYNKAIEILKKEEKKLEILSKELLIKETLIAKEVYDLLNIPFNENNEKILLQDN